MKLESNDSAMKELRVENAAEVLAEPMRYDLAMRGKAFCILAYRSLLDGLGLDLDALKRGLEGVVMESKRNGQYVSARWFASCQMALVYLAAKSGEEERIAAMCEPLLDLNLMVHNNFAAVNMSRAVILRAACLLRMGRKTEAASVLPRVAEMLARLSSWLHSRPRSTKAGDEFIDAARMAQAAIYLMPWCDAPYIGRRPSRAEILGIEKREPFRSTLNALLLEDSGVWWHEEDERYSALYRRGYAAARPMEAVLLAGCQKSERVLDLGCGRAVLSEYFEDYTGVDVSSLAISQDKTDRRGSFYHSSLDDLSCVAGRVFDTVLCTDVMEHIPPAKVEAVLAEIARINASRFLLAICCRPSRVLGPGGENLHPTIEPPAWWQEKLKGLFAVAVLAEKPDWVLFDCRPPAKG